MDPSVFLTAPNDNGVKGFLRVARPSIRRWVKNHYERFRRSFEPPALGFPGSHGIEPGFMLTHHLQGEYFTNEDNVPTLRASTFDRTSRVGGRGGLDALPLEVIYPPIKHTRVGARPQDAFGHPEFDTFFPRIDTGNSFGIANFKRPNEIRMREAPGGGSVFEAAAPLQADLRQGGQSVYFLLPSLARMMVDNIRLGLATPNDIVEWMAVTLLTFDQKQPGPRSADRNRTNIFDTFVDGGVTKYDFFRLWENVIVGEPIAPGSELDAMLDNARVSSQLHSTTPGAANSFPNTRQATNTLSVQYEGELEDFKDIEPDKFRNSIKQFLKPLLDRLDAKMPIGQVLGILETNRVRPAQDSTGRAVPPATWKPPANQPDPLQAIREGTWRVTRTGRRDKKPVVDVASTVNPDYIYRGVLVSNTFVPVGQPDLRQSADLRNSAALALFERVVDAFIYIEHMNTLALSKINHSRFTKEHFRDYDGTYSPPNSGIISIPLPPGAAPRAAGDIEGIGGVRNQTGDGSKFFGDWFIDARTDHTTAFFANMWHKKKGLRKTLENLFKDNNFALAEIQWYSQIVSKHLNPALIPAMSQNQLPTRAVLVPPAAAFPAGVAPQMTFNLEMKDIELKLESPLLRDAYLEYSRQFNEWFASLLVGANRGFLYEQPFGPAGPSGNDKAKKIKSARESMSGAVKEAWNMVRSSILSLRNLDVTDGQIIQVLQEEVNQLTGPAGAGGGPAAGQAAYLAGIPTIPPGGANDLNTYLDFISGLYDSNIMFLAAFSTAVDRMRIDNTADIQQVEEMFITDIKKHLKMKAIGTVTFPALAVATEILRDYIIIPAAQTQQFVATQLNADIQARIAARAAAPQGFTVPAEPAIAPPQAPPILQTEVPP